MPALGNIWGALRTAVAKFGEPIIDPAVVSSPQAIESSGESVDRSASIDSARGQWWPTLVKDELKSKFPDRFLPDRFGSLNLPKEQIELIITGYRSYNIVFFQGLFYGWPWSAGHFSLERFLADWAPGAVVGETIKDVRNLVDCYLGGAEDSASGGIDWDDAHQIEERLINRTRSIENMKARSVILDNKPVKIVASTAFGCNIECKMCYLLGEDTLAYDGPYGRANMSPETWAKVTEILPTTEVALMTVEGEILVHTKWFSRWLEVAKANPNLKLAFQTNGMVMNERVINLIMENPNIAAVAVSIDGVTPEVFNSIRVRAKLDVVLKNLAALIETKQRLNRASPGIETHFVMMKENIHELPAYVESMLKLGVNTINAGHLIARRREDICQSLYFDQKRADRYIIEARDIADRSTNPLAIRLPETFASAKARNARRPACYDPWFHGQVLHDGSVWSCCNNAVMMGNVNTAGSFEAVWNNDKYRLLRETVNDDEPYFTACKHCYAMLPLNAFEAHIDTRLLFNMLEEGGRALVEQWSPGPIDLRVKPGESYVE